MKILKLTLRFPYPPMGGASLRDYNLLQRLSKEHEIALFSFVDNLPTEEEFAHMKQFCKHIFVTPGGHKTLRAGVRNALEFAPYHVTSFRSRSMKQAVESHLATHDMDVIDATTIQLTQYFPRNSRMIKVLDPQNADRQVWGRLASEHPNRLMRLIAQINLIKTRAYERRVYPALDVAVSVSQQDLEITRSFAPDNLALHLAPNGVDTDYFAPMPEIAERDDVLLLCGGLNQEATVDAINFFVSELWPAVRQVRPNAELWLVGRDPTKAIQGLSGREGITVTASVPDVRPYYAAASIVLAPFRLGGGTKLKVLNAMSMGKTVVATPIGAQGLELDSASIAIAESASEFAANVLRLLANPEERRKIGQLARSEMVAKYDWSAIAEGYSRAIITAAQRRPVA